jgi:hypothetical protein
VRRLQLALIPVGLVLAIIAEWSSFAAGKQPGDGLVGIVLVTCGAVALIRTTQQRSALLMVVAGFAWFAVRSNQAISQLIFVSSKTIEAHVRQILLKLGLHESPDDHRRVLATLVYLRTTK